MASADLPEIAVLTDVGINIVSARTLVPSVIRLSSDIKRFAEKAREGFPNYLFHQEIMRNLAENGLAGLIDTWDLEPIQAATQALDNHIEVLVDLSEQIETIQDGIRDLRNPYPLFIQKRGDIVNNMVENPRALDRVALEQAANYLYPRIGSSRKLQARESEEKKECRLLLTSAEERVNKALDSARKTVDLAYQIRRKFSMIIGLHVQIMSQVDRAIKTLEESGPHSEYFTKKKKSLLGDCRLLKKRMVEPIAWNIPLLQEFKRILRNIKQATWDVRQAHDAFNREN